MSLKKWAAALAATAALASTVAVVPAASAQTLRWAAQNDILTMDPHSQNHATTNAILMHAYEGLTRYSATYQIEPALQLRVLTPKFTSSPVSVCNDTRIPMLFAAIGYYLFTATV